jgi:hypothetical protein
MRCQIRVAALASLLAISALAAPAYASAAARASATPRTSVVPQIIGGKTCKNVHSQSNWQGQICIQINWDDAVGDTQVQALVTYSIRSGTLREVYVAGGLYLRNCGVMSSCWNRAYTQSPYKFTSGRSSFISTRWVSYDPYYAQPSEQARASTPCIIWTNNQVACYNGHMKSGWGTLRL